MNKGATWGIALGVGIPGVLIIIGLLGFLIKFVMKRCRKKAWDNITTPPKNLDSAENGLEHRILGKRKASDRQPLYQPGTNNALDVSDSHIIIPIDERDIPSGRHKLNQIKEHNHTLVQIQRDRLNRLKEEETRARPMLRLNASELDIQRAIDQAQKEFEESVGTAVVKMKRRRDK